MYTSHIVHVVDSNTNCDRCKPKPNPLHVLYCAKCYLCYCLFTFCMLIKDYYVIIEVYINKVLNLTEMNCKCSVYYVCVFHRKS